MIYYHTLPFCQFHHWRYLPACVTVGLAVSMRASATSFSTCWCCKSLFSPSRQSAMDLSYKTAKAFHLQQQNMTADKAGIYGIHRVKHNQPCRHSAHIMSHVCAYMQACMYPCTHTHTHTCAHMQAQTHMHTHNLLTHKAGCIIMGTAHLHAGCIIKCMQVV